MKFWKKTNKPPFADKGWWNDLLVILTVYLAGVGTGVALVIMAS